MRILDAKAASAGHMTLAEIDVLPSAYDRVVLSPRQTETVYIPFPVAHFSEPLLC